jgi:uncharacterized RDD family membrane protein YckC
MPSNVPQQGGAPPPPPSWGNQQQPSWGAAPPPPSWDQAAASGPVRYAGFWLRLVALIIDGFIVNIVAALIGFVLGVGVGATGGGTEDAQIAGGLIGFLLGLLYFALLESSSAQATLGKMALGLKVTKGDGSRISFGRAIGRYLAKIISGIILFIGYIMAAFTDRKRALHDMIADTVVIRAR